MSAAFAVLKFLFKSKFGKFILALVGGLLVAFAIVMFTFWNHYLCKFTFGMFNDDCKENEEVLVYEPVEEKDIRELGKTMMEMRDGAQVKVIDKEVIEFLKSHGITELQIDVPGESYRQLMMDIGGFDGTGGGGGSSMPGGGQSYDVDINGITLTQAMLTKERLKLTPAQMKKYYGWALRVSGETGWHPLFLMAQWSEETSWFTSANFRNNNNIAGQTTHDPDDPRRGTARPRNEGAWYIKYDDPVEGYIDFVHNNPRYSQVKNYKTAEDQAVEIKRAGWATNPNYVKNLTSIISKYRRLLGEPTAIPNDGSGNIEITEPEIEAPAEETVTDKEAEATGEKIVEIAEKYWKSMGEGQPDKTKWVKYLMGGDNLRQGGQADCSDFAGAVYKEAGISIAGYTGGQFSDSRGEFVDTIGALQKGDLVFFRPDGSGGHAVTYKGKAVTVSHVGIYIGNGQMLHLNFGEANSTKTINKQKITSGYYKDQFIVGKRFTGEVPEEAYVPGEGDLLNEAEMHLRALHQADLHALNALELNEETLEKEPFKDKKIYKTWIVAKEIKKRGEASTNKNDPYYKINKRAVEAEKNDMGQNWKAMNWILYAQFEAYKCYMLGDEGNVNWWLKLLQIFGLGDNPCSTLNELYQAGGGSGQFIAKTDQGMLRHQHAIVEGYWSECIDNPLKVSQTSHQFVAWIEMTGHKMTHWVDTVYAAHNNLYIEPGPKPNCGKDAYTVLKKKATRYVTYQSLMTILYGFEPYAMFETDVTVDKKDGTYKYLIDFILTDMYQDQTGGSNLPFVPSGDYIVPMETGTYNFSSPRGIRNGRMHEGIDLGTATVPRVPVYATASGKVILARNLGGGWSTYGGLITIDHMNGMYSMYAHFWSEDIVVQVGQTVAQGQLIGGAGNDTTTSDWHLHFEMCTTVNALGVCAVRVNPQDYVSGFGQQSISLTRERSSKFVNEWRSASKGGSLFMMPGFQPKDDSATKDAENAEYFEIHPQYGHILGAYKMKEREDNNGTLGNLYAFGDFIKESYPAYYKALSPYSPETAGFVQLWKGLSKKDAIGFTKAQKEFLK